MKNSAFELLLALLFASEGCMAYGCSKPASVQEAVEADRPLVFTGTVSDIEHWTERMTAVKFAVDALHRGDAGKKVVVIFGLDGRDTDWKLGERYSVSAGSVQLSGTPDRTPRLFRLGTNYSAHACDLIARAEDAAGESPHAQAIRMVMETRSNEIRSLDRAGDWWHDVKERSWSAKRPIHPGVVDSTHLFRVTYSIDGKVVGSWSVNTRTGQVVGPGESLHFE